MDSSTFLLELYNKLKSGPQTIDSIYSWTKQKNFEISKRSIYRYLEKIENATSEIGDVLSISTEEFNKKKWQIVSSSNTHRRKETSELIKDLSNILIASKTLPIWFSNKNSIKEAFESEIKKYPKNAFKYSSLLSIENNFSNTHFGELIFNSKLNANLLDILWCIDNEFGFEIVEYDELTNASNQAIPDKNTLLKPIEVIFHRGNYLIRCISVSLNSMYVVELDNILTIKISQQRIKKSKTKLLDSKQKINFGYHPSYHNKTYKIKLQFPPTPGVHVMARNWHPNQSFEVLDNGNIIMSFDSDLNIELVGWIMMWMENVKVISPTSLKNIIKTKAQKTIELYSKNIDPSNNSNSSFI